MWKRNIIKEKRNRGEKYTNWRGNVIEERKIKKGCNNCRRKCQDKFNLEEHTDIFSSYWRGVLEI